MSEQHGDPSGNTEAFRAFTQRQEPAADSGGGFPTMLVVTGVVAVIVVAVIVYLVVM